MPDRRRDRFHLYQLAVQHPAAEIDLIERLFREQSGRTAHILREDFCGTAAVAIEWVRRRPEHHAWGVDYDPEALIWGRRQVRRLLTSEQQERIQLLTADVLHAETPPVDMVLALNFSYWLLDTRAALLTYFQRVRTQLVPGGLFVLDAHGGPDAQRLTRERRRIHDPTGEDFDYCWERAAFDPISGRQVCHIHFQFDDGVRLERAFSYHWRLWTLPEIRELLEAAGFTAIQVYWQGWTAQNQADGYFVPVAHGEPDEAWIAYISASG
ncbi:hypothetical protein SAMN05421644_10943 [Allochromatium warmingii]|uniref:Methyltransferase domain-containing protein n=1 Tax=Allochromatium warmingii TaxID=61595 RepID=A0A1H3DM41_ALLWA|nr:class I SAM-dependent methyltransferase [Allochromatium warmingii]SDX67485.1 hypothetical protein SAMN05421644_10943 [Allochromatium warmingii]